MHLLPIISSLIWASLQWLYFLLIKFKNGGNKQGHLFTDTYTWHSNTKTHTDTQIMEFMGASDTVIKGEVEGSSAWGPWRGHASPSHKNTQLSLRLQQQCSQWVHLEVNHSQICMQTRGCHHLDSPFGALPLTTTYLWSQWPREEIFDNRKNPRLHLVWADQYSLLFCLCQNKQLSVCPWYCLKRPHKPIVQLLLLTKQNLANKIPALAAGVGCKDLSEVKQSVK